MSSPWILVLSASKPQSTCVKDGKLLHGPVPPHLDPPEILPSVQSLRFVPPKAHPTQTALETSAPSAPGVHDALRSRLGQTSIVQPSTGSSSKAPVVLQSAHPLEARLVQWRDTQDRIKMKMLRRQFGIAEPVRRGMELKIASAGEWRPAVLGGSSGVHRDILEGRDCEVGWEDVFKGKLMRPPLCMLGYNRLLTK